MERIKKAANTSQAANTTNPNIIPFVNNSGSIDLISNVIDEKFSDINLS